MLKRTMVALALSASALMATSAIAARSKNQAPPARKIYAPLLADDTMKAHPELLSMTSESARAVFPGAANHS